MAKRTSNKRAKCLLNQARYTVNSGNETVRVSTFCMNGFGDLLRYFTVID